MVQLETKREFLLAHPPSGGIDSEQPKEEAKAPLFDEAKLAAGITAGMKDVLVEMNRRDEPAPVRHVQAPIDDVSEEEIFAAHDAGDKTKAAQLLRKARAADRERTRREELSPILSNGTAAFASVAKQAAKDIPYYSRFQKEIDGEITKWQTNNPTAILTYEHYKAATELVSGRHAAEIANEAREEGIRKAREPEPELDIGGRHLADNTEKEPTTLVEVLGSDWKEQFRRKSRAPGMRNRGEDEEMSAAGFGSVAGFIAKRKELVATEEETNGSFGLDREWSHTEKRWMSPEESRRLPVPQD